MPVSRLDARLSSREVHQALSETELDPFLVVSQFEMAGPVFPPHPHAGFSVATYILPESPIGFLNQDSLGTRNEIKPGGLHATVAGAGVLHEEQPVSTAGVVHGYQIWIDHANGQRAVSPRPETLDADRVPERRDTGVAVRVLIGHSGDVRSPVNLPTAVRLLDVTMEAHGTFRETLQPVERGFLVMLAGEATIGATTVETGQVATLTMSGDTLRVDAGATGARLTLFLGVPLAQPRVYGGPVVGGSREEVDAFLRAARAGAFGTLRAF